MAEISPIDSISTPVYQLNTKRTGVNPFAPVDKMADNAAATKVQENPFHQTEELIEAFDLYDPKNRYKILNLFSRDQQQEVLGLLGDDSLVLGMKLYDEEKILNLLFDTSQQDISKVLMGALPMEKIFEMIPEEFFNKFIVSDELEKDNFMQAFQLFSQEDLSKLMESMTGIPQKNISKDVMLNTLSSIPLEKLQPSLLTITPKQKIKLVSNMMKTNQELFNLFPKAQLLMPLDKIGKEQTLQGFGNLDPEVTGGMLKQLPDELLPLLLTLIPTEKLANALINKYQDVILAALENKSQASS